MTKCFMMAILVVATLGLTNPAMAALFLVENTQDSGPGTLRTALENSNSFSDNDEIIFALQPSDSVIRPLTALPPIIAPVSLTLSATAISQNSRVTLSGEFAGDVDGLDIRASAVNISSLVIINFQRSGIVISGKIAGVVVEDCLIGTDGLECQPNAHHGIVLKAGVTKSVIGGTLGNVISGNGFDGVRILDLGTSGNQISGNFIGLDSLGANAIGNGWRAQLQLPDWTTLAPDDICTPQLRDDPTEDTEGVGLVDGTLGGGGVLVANGASENLIGDKNQLTGNVIAGNLAYGIKVTGVETQGNLIAGNFIGIGIDGASVVPNESDGIEVRHGATGTLIGLEANPESGNLIGGNNCGISIVGGGVEDTSINNNSIGLSKFSGKEVFVPNRLAGVLLSNGATQTRIGNDKQDGANTIAGNSVAGIYVRGKDTVANSFSRNKITANASAGIFIQSKANGDIAAPAIQKVSPTTIAGISQPGSRVDIYADQIDEGAFHIGTTKADSAGNWLLIGSFSKFPAPYLTAMATDAKTLGSSAFSSPFETPQAEGEGVAPLTPDLLADLLVMKTTPFLNFVPEPYRGYLQGLDLENGDFNGGVSITVTALPSSLPIQSGEEDGIVFSGNGIPDSQELRVIEKLLREPGIKLPEISGAEVKKAYESNRLQIRDRYLGPTLGKAVEMLLPAILDVFSAFSLGGGGSVIQLTDRSMKADGPVGAIDGYLKLFNAGVEKIAPARLNQPFVVKGELIAFSQLGAQGDLDGDGASNAEEWKSFGPGRFESAVLDPLVFPEIGGEGEGEGKQSSRMGCGEATITDRNTFAGDGILLLSLLSFLYFWRKKICP